MHHLHHNHDNSFGFVNFVCSRDPICEGPGRAERILDKELTDTMFKHLFQELGHVDED